MVCDMEGLACVAGDEIGKRRLAQGVLNATGQTCFIAKDVSRLSRAV